jgi:hypothetical protein
MTTNSIHNAFINALLADATYVDGLTSPTGLPLSGASLVDRLKEKRFSPDLAQYFGDHFEVVTQKLTSDLTESGFDATAWREKGSGQVYISMRGTEGLMDFAADADLTTSGLARHQIAAMVPQGEQLFTDVSIKNDDVGFVQLGQSAQVKLAAYPFQKYGMLMGKVIHISADATQNNQGGGGSSSSSSGTSSSDAAAAAVAAMATYKVRVRLDDQVLKDPQGRPLTITAGMQVVAEINQGKRTVLEYLLSPVQKAVQESGRER